MSPALNHGQTSHGLRGDYARMRADYTIDQDHAAYSEEEHDRWRRLYRRQIGLVEGRELVQDVVQKSRVIIQEAYKAD